MKFKDSYGKVVKPGDTIVIETLYRSGRNEGRRAEVQWDEQHGMFQYKTDAMHSFDDFYGVHRFKKVKP